MCIDHHGRGADAETEALRGGGAQASDSRWLCPAGQVLPVPTREGDRRGVQACVSGCTLTPSLLERSFPPGDFVPSVRNRCGRLAGARLRRGASTLPGQAWLSFLTVSADCLSLSRDSKWLSSCGWLLQGPGSHPESRGRFIPLCRLPGTESIGQGRSWAGGGSLQGQITRRGSQQKEGRLTHWGVKTFQTGGQRGSGFSVAGSTQFFCKGPESKYRRAEDQEAEWDILKYSTTRARAPS